MKLNDYYKISNNSDLIKRFSYLIKKLMFTTDDFTKENAAEVLQMIDNDQEKIEELAQAFRDSGEEIKEITEENWVMLRNLMVAMLEQE